MLNIRLFKGNNKVFDATFWKEKPFRYFAQRSQERSCRQRPNPKKNTFSISLFVFTMTSRFQTRFSISVPTATVRRYIINKKEKWWSNNNNNNTMMLLMISNDLEEGRIGRIDRGSKPPPSPSSRLLCNTRYYMYLREIAAKHRDRLSRQMFGAQDAIIQTNARCARVRPCLSRFSTIIVNYCFVPRCGSDFRKAIVFWRPTQSCYCYVRTFLRWGEVFFCSFFFFGWKVRLLWLWFCVLLLQEVHVSDLDGWIRMISLREYDIVSVNRRHLFF